jgi:dihydrofolate synthase/folylpolyglutamate synthase
MNILGDSLPKIAAEKAGIIKKEIPVVVGEVLEETVDVFEKKAAEKKAPLFIASQKRQVAEWSWEKHALVTAVAEGHKTDHTIYKLDLSGIYQTKNLLTVLETCYQLQQKGWRTDTAAIQKALPHVKKLTGLHGRWDVIQEHPLVILDVAHNEAGMLQVIEQLEVTDHHELHIILGMVKDKEVNNVLQLLPATAHYYFTQANIPRALDTEALQTQAAAFNLKGNTYADVNTALKAAKDGAAKNDLVLVCGSVFLVGEVNY